MGEYLSKKGQYETQPEDEDDSDEEEEKKIIARDLEKIKSKLSKFHLQSGGKDSYFIPR